MTSRSTLFTALAFALVTTVLRTAAADAGRQYYELRVYLTKSAEQQKRINDYWQNAAVPAYNRLGIQPIGVFTEIDDSPTNSIYVLLPSDSFEAFETVPAKLAADAVYQTAATDFLNAPKTNAAYERFETSLLVAFDGMKRMSLPPADKKPTVFELRNYISSSENKGLNKIKMFESGEISVMKESRPRADFLFTHARRLKNAEPRLHDLRRKPRGAQPTLERILERQSVERPASRPPIQRQRLHHHQNHPETHAGIADLSQHEPV